MTALVALLGMGASAGLILMVVGLVGLQPRAARPRHRRPGKGDLRRLEVRLGIAAGVALLVGLITRWPVGALLSGGFVVAAPAFFGGRRTARLTIARLEAIAAWTEMLRDTMAAAAGIEHAIVSSARVAPEPIEREVLELAARLDSREPLGPALRAFADQLDDPSADLVIVSLVLAAEQRARHLVDLLGALAVATREEVTMRLRVETARARVRTSARIISLIAFSLAAGLMLFDRGYLRPFGTLFGQLVLLLVGGCFAAAFWWLAKMSRVQVAERFLTADRTGTTLAGR
jgi:tight adherence protein B